jgi:hypothetical protein
MSLCLENPTPVNLPASAVSHEALQRPQPQEPTARRVGGPRRILTGLKFGRLMVADPVDQKNGHWRWMCKCECGGSLVVLGGSLVTNRTKSCGCLHSETGAKLKLRHGHARAGKCSKAYSKWASMIARCTNPAEISYPNYGGRGIKVCDRWLHSFDNFLADLGEPVSGQIIDRIDVNGNYEPSNVRWVSRKDSARNTRKTVWVVYLGSRMSVAEAADLCGVSSNTLRARIKAGVPESELFNPIKTKIK